MPAGRPLLLLLDDEEATRRAVGLRAGQAGFEVVECADHEAALALLEGRRVDVAMAGLDVPGTDATDLLRAIHRVDPSCQVVVMSHDASPEAAVLAVRLGAADYLVKPVDERRLGERFSSLRNEVWRRRHLLASEAEVARHLEFFGMVGRGAAMQELFASIRRLAPHTAVALVTGETGTGKELVARALHALGSWRSEALTAASCAALSTPRPDRDRPAGPAGGPSVFDCAPRGTLLLDEVSELAPGVQEALLRFLGSADGGRAEGRGPADGPQIVAVTGRDLRARVAAGRFRRDLYRRLAEVTLHVPPLRDRREDIPYLAAHFVREFSREFHQPLRGLTVAAERCLLSASWPGNVRELRNVLERACLLAEGDVISEREVGYGRLEAVEHPPAGPPTAEGSPEWAPSSVAPLAAMERDCVLKALQQAGGNKKVAARLLGLSRRAFYRRLERHQLEDLIHRRGGSPATRQGSAVA